MGLSVRGWFKVVRPLVFLGAGGLLMNNELMNKSAPKLAFSSGAKRVQSENMYGIVGRCLDEMKMDVRKLVLMIGSGLSAFSGGDKTAPNGVVLVLPPTYFANTDPSIYSQLRDSVDPNTPLGQHLDDFVPTPETVRYSIFHELSHIRNNDSATRALMLSGCLIAGYEVWGRKVLFVNKTLKKKAVWTTALVAVAVVINIMFMWHQELRADREAARVDEQACVGGLGSISLRQTIEKALGVSPYRLSPSHPPLSLRLFQLQHIHKTYQQ
eukprot:m.121322 g.121322  ORF g.121322 m.121322 type:complete len:269 (+) comp12921_c2_seq1:39-845(+)